MTRRKTEVSYFMSGKSEAAIYIGLYGDILPVESPKKSKKDWDKGMASIEYETPQDFFDTLDKEFHFTLDVAATAANAKV